MTNPTAPDIRAIPLVILNFNQLTYLKNLINKFRWYYPENPIVILDNGSDATGMFRLYKHLTDSDFNIRVVECGVNDCPSNLRKFLQENTFEYYILSDPDIDIQPSTPSNFIEIFKAQIDLHNYHRVGFGLKTSDIPDWNHEKAMIVQNETELIGEPVFHSHGFPCYKAPIDTTFCLYKASNGGWSAPMDGANWSNCLRMFEAVHLGWYIDPDHVNAEMDYYFKTAKYRVPGEISAGVNNNRPTNYIK